MPFKEIGFSSPLHAKIKTAIQERSQMSRRKMQERTYGWDQAEKRMQAYVPAKDAERQANRAKEETNFTQIEIPMVYAMMLTSHTYHSSVFLSRAPILQVQGRHGEAEHQVLAQEALLDYQVNVGGHIPVYTVWLLDVNKYGVGIIGTDWAEERAQVSEIVERPVVKDGIELPGRTQKVKESRRGTIFEGNKVYNVRPFDWFPDPRVALQNFQEGEFCGRQTRISWNDFVKGVEDGKYFNKSAVEASRTPSGIHSYDSGYGQQGDNPALVEVAKEDQSYNRQNSKRDKNMLDVLEMAVELIPSEWELGEGNYPEMWVFTMVNDKIIVGAQPMGLNHNKFPFEVLENEVDGYGLSSRGMFEIGEPLAQSMDWLANSHFFNVQKALNNEYVVDPSAVVMKDFLDKRPGKVVRLRPSAYGKDPRQVIHQLAQTDYTRTHLQDMRVIEGLFQRVFGINENLMGAGQSTGRKSATEARQSSTFGISRMKSQAEWFSATGWTGLSQMFIQNNQQLYTAEKKFRIAGNNIQGQGKGFVDVNQESLMGFYDFIPVDGTLPVDRFAQASLWKEIFSQIRNMPPEVAMGYDWAAVFGWMAKLAGLKNIDMFRKAPEVQAQSDEHIAREAQKGNLVPMSEVSNGQVGASITGASGDQTGVVGAPQIGGMGPTG